MGEIEIETKRDAEGPKGSYLVFANGSLVGRVTKYDGKWWGYVNEEFGPGGRSGWCGTCGRLRDAAREVALEAQRNRLRDAAVEAAREV